MIDSKHAAQALEGVFPQLKGRKPEIVQISHESLVLLYQTAYEAGRKQGKAEGEFGSIPDLQASFFNGKN